MCTEMNYSCRCGVLASFSRTSSWYFLWLLSFFFRSMHLLYRLLLLVFVIMREVWSSTETSSNFIWKFSNAGWTLSLWESFVFSKNICDGPCWPFIILGWMSYFPKHVGDGYRKAGVCPRLGDRGMPCPTRSQCQNDRQCPGQQRCCYHCRKTVCVNPASKREEEDIRKFNN